ncbi:diacylglycerol kinase family protein [Patescibacteria group bacterium]|nr:diacylglycerol kinase family protein [Patescibacteria group bacterium]
MGYEHPLPKSFRFAFSGVRTALREEPNFKIHILIAILAAILGFFLKLAPIEWLVLTLTVAMVLILELMNTSLEVLVDIVSPEIHEKAKIAKDVAAASVLLASISAVIVGLIIFLPKILIILALTK